MEENVKNQDKMSYEQLEQVAAQLSEQLQQLYARLQQVELSNTFKRLEFLFKVIENIYAFDSDFTTKCVKEIEDIMTIPEEDKEEDNPKNEE